MCSHVLHFNHAKLWINMWEVWSGLATSGDVGLGSCLIRRLAAIGRPTMRFNKVVFPAPEGPIKATISPACTRQRTSSKSLRPPELALQWQLRNGTQQRKSMKVGSFPSSAFQTKIFEKQSFRRMMSYPCQIV